MSHHSKGDRGEYEFTRAATDTLNDVEKACEVVISTDLQISKQRGVLALVMHAVAKGGGDGLTYVATYQADWPNAYAVSFAAFYFQCAHRLARMVEAWYQEKAAEKWRRG